MTNIKTYSGNVKALLKKDGLDISHLRAINVKTGQIHNNRGYLTWYVANNGKRNSGQFAKK